VKTELRVSEATARFLEAGRSITVATRDDALEPDGAPAWAARVHDDGGHLTLFLHEEAARGMLRNLEAHPEIAILFDQPSASRACQVKGTFLSSRRARAAERALVERQVEGLLRELEAIGIPRAMTTAWRTWPCLALDVRIERLFEQTPGPGAGEPLP
jgi:hypothetical protein